jgi:alpha-galactosidase
MKGVLAVYSRLIEGFRISPAVAGIITSVMFSCVLTAQTATPASVKAEIAGKNLRVEFDRMLRSRVIARFDNRETPLGPFTASETVTTTARTVTQFTFSSQKSERVTDSIGSGQKLTVVGKAENLTKAVAVTVYDQFPAMAFFDVQYTNSGTANISITKWINNAYTVNAQSKVGIPAFWSYQSGSYEKRPNWVVPLKANFSQKNYLGMNANDYGGGTPVVDVWRRDVGIAVGHVELRPKLVSLPVSMPDSNHAKVAVELQRTIVL